MPSAKQYSLYPGAYAPIPIPQISVPSPVPATTNIYSDLGMDVGFLASMGEGGGEGAESLDSGATLGATGSNTSGVTAAQASSIGSFAGNTLGALGGVSPLGTAALGIGGSTLGAALGVGPQGNTSAAAQAAATKGAISLSLSAVNPLLGLVFNLFTPLEAIAEAQGNQPNTTPGFGFNDLGLGVTIGPGQGLGSDESTPAGFDLGDLGLGLTAPSDLGLGLGASPAEGGFGGSEGGFGDSTGDGTGGGFGAGSVGASGEGE